MDLLARRHSLETKHADLDLRIREEQAKVHPDELVVADLKRRKLHIKDEIMQLRRSPAQVEPALGIG